MALDAHTQEKPPSNMVRKIIIAIGALAWLGVVLLFVVPQLTKTPGRTIIVSADGYS